MCVLCRFRRRRLSPPLMSLDFARSSSLLLSLPLILSHLFSCCFVSMVVAAVSMRRDEVHSPLFVPLTGVSSLPTSGSPLRYSFQLPSFRWLSFVSFLFAREAFLSRHSVASGGVSQLFHCSSSMYRKFSHFHPHPNDDALPSCIAHTLTPVFKAT